MIIDIHTHILYDIDDGAKNISESMNLIKQETENNVGVIVLTPHFNPYDKNASMEIFTQKCHERYDNIMRHILAENIRNIRLILGSEVFYSPMLLYYSELSPLCINNTRYLLIEFALDMKFDKKFFAELEKLMLKFDIIPIIAHAERYIYIQKHINIIKEFKYSGGFIQINSDYIINNIDDKFVRQLFKYDYTDIIASDCHDLKTRIPDIKKAGNLIDKKYNYYYSEILSKKNNINLNLNLTEETK